MCWQKEEKKKKKEEKLSKLFEQGSLLVKQLKNRHCGIHC